MDNFIPFELKRLTYDSVLLPFDCGNKDLTDYFFNSAKKDITKLLTVVYYYELKGETAFFFTLSNDRISEVEIKGKEPLYSKSFFRKIKDKFEEPNIAEIILWLK